MQWVQWTRACLTPQENKLSKLFKNLILFLLLCILKSEDLQKKPPNFYFFTPSHRFMLCIECWMIRARCQWGRVGLFIIQELMIIRPPKYIHIDICWCEKMRRSWCFCDEEGNSEMESSLDITVSSGLFYKAQMEEIACCYTGIFNAGLSISPFTLCLYLIMLCEFWIFPPALKWNVNY